MNSLKKINKVNNHTQLNRHKMKKSNKLTKKIKTFSRLSRPEKRIAIAKDVLAQIKLKNIIPMEGSYVEIPLKNNEVGKQLQDLLPKKKCNCCALGSCFVSLVSIENNFVVQDGYIGASGNSNMGYIDKTSFNNRLKKYFTQFQLDLIETAFEGTTSYIIGSDTSNKFEDAREFYFKFGSVYDRNRTPQQQEECLIAIMKNIITNKGTFKP